MQRYIFYCGKEVENSKNQIPNSKREIHKTLTKFQTLSKLTGCRAEPKHCQPLFFNKLLHQSFQSVQFKLVHFGHHPAQFSLGKAFSFEPHKVIFRNICQIITFVFSKGHFIICQFHQMVWVWAISKIHNRQVDWQCISARKLLFPRSGNGRFRRQIWFAWRVFSVLPVCRYLLFQILFF